MSGKPLSAKDRRALLDTIAAKKKQQQQHPNIFRDFEDSDDGTSFTSARSRPSAALTDDSSEEENSGPRVASCRDAAPAAKLNRLRKAAAVPLPPTQQQQLQQHTLPKVAADELASLLGDLSVKGKPSGGTTMAPGARAMLGLAPSHSMQPARDSLKKQVEATDQDSRCLVLGASGEFRLNAKVSTMLYPHQVEGIKWLWSLHKLGRGGILADDMGLGKTLQCTAFLAGLIQGRLINRAIVVAPKTLLAQWQKELALCGLQSQAHEYGGSAGERDAALRSVVRYRGVLLTTYGMVLHNAAALARHVGHDPDGGPMWDVMICDEGHKLKNPRMKLREALDAVPVGMRVIISGTPIQNNLTEMWALFNFCAPDVLGDAPDFRDRYEKLITVGSDKHATEYERERGAVAAARLRQEVGPYMLRREKKEVFKPQDAAAAARDGSAGSHAGAETGSQLEAGGSGAGGGGKECSKPATMPHKNDLIVWLKLEPMQRRVYQAFLNSDAVKKVFNQTSSALAAITVLKKVCDHPALLSDRAAHNIVSGVDRARRQAAAALGGGDDGSSEAEEIDGSSDDEEEEEWKSGSESCSSDDERQHQRSKQQQQRRTKQQQRQEGKAQKRAAGRPVEGPVAAVAAGGAEELDLWTSADIEQRLLEEVHTTGFAASCKTVFVMALLKNLVAEGHRTLVFSQSRVMLNILESAIKEQQWRYCRIDGSVASAAERQARVQQFQGSSSIPVFLLTSQVGGLGLTLTAADRVIILDPAWNPSTDNQSVDRAYRIGQRRDVVVYRLISCGTVEEKIYRRQVFKGGLSRTGMEEGEQLRYFAAQDLRDLFRLDPSECEASLTQRELHDMHAAQRRETPELTRHLAFLRTLGCYAGVSDHDLLFSVKAKEAPAGGPLTRPAVAARPSSSSSSSSAPAYAAGGPSPRKQALFGKTATQGWSGGSELSDMFARVTVSAPASGGSSAAVAAAAQPPGISRTPPAPALVRLDQSPRVTTQERIADLEGLLERKVHLLTLSSLPDGGAKVRAQIAELESELADVKRECVPAAAAAPEHRTSSQRHSPADGGRAAAPASSAALWPLPSAPAVPPQAALQQPAAQPLASAAAPAAAGAAAAVPPSAKPPASPLFARMRDMLWAPGSSKQLGSADAMSATGAPGSYGSGDWGASHGAARTATVATTGSSQAVPERAQAQQQQRLQQHSQQQQQQQQQQQLSNVVVLSQDAPPTSTGIVGSRTTSSSSGGGGGQASAAMPAAHADAGPPQAAKPQPSSKELKARLMATLQAIKAAESGGYFDRQEVEKLRRRAAKLAQQREDLKEGL
ncbi:hypothetical protein D9Q98_005576 [Chlorella vulgaris]|uniref:Uncharacterized protein n=1 Tax=Chlorella vulgaris TaxID=3077 RepID=A0A9D4TMF2_CHLVU|nr:hypothetical protein D9Q98_005576 [Chlorella vulgaris]